VSDYANAREVLRSAELELMQQRETVAQLRRDLPPGPTVDDYVFASSTGDVTLSGLFTSADRSLVLYHFMLGKQQDQACPMCSMWADGWNAVADHLADSLDFAVVTAASVDRTEELVAEKGWTNLRWLSAADNTFKVDIGGEDDAGNQSPFISVWQLVDGRRQMTYSGGANIIDEHWRGVDLLSPVWHIQDLTRQGRGDWFPSLSY
jgi:predicted dithiol-disulfide oxidoreductase (DUF899 family)